MNCKTVATWICAEDEHWFAERFAPAASIRLENARLKAVTLENCAGLLLTGGCDVGQAFLRQPVPDPALVRNDEPGRDEWEFAALAEADRRKLPILAICRGVQVLNVFRGGTLQLDVPDHQGPVAENTQPIAWAAGVAPAFSGVNSEHHQALDQLGAGLIVEGRSAADGLVEQVRGSGAVFCLGVQYHPERDAMYQPIFEYFIAAVLGRDV